MRVPEFHLPTIMFKPKFWPSVMTLVMVAGLMALGIWQTQRSEWKTALIAERAAKLSEKPMTLNALPDGPVENLYYRSAYVTTKIKIARPYYTFSATPDHGVGFQLYFPQTWNDDRWLLRKSDFVTMDEWKSGALRWPSNDELAATPPREQLGVFLPLDDAENMIILKEQGSEPIRPLNKIEPVIFVRIDEWGSIQHELFKSRLLNISNNHATYALIWFALAIAMTFIYFSSHTKITFKD